MTAKMDWELSHEERNQRHDEGLVDGSTQQAYWMEIHVFPPKADLRDSTGAPLYYGWAIREAFLAGVRWERERAEATDDPLNHLPMGAGFPIG